MARLPLKHEPQSICLLRLSAIGDISHSLPILRSIQAHWPKTKISWIIGRTEYSLVQDIEDIDFIVFDKRLGWQAYRKLHRALQGRRFDVLLHMQMSLRASLISLLVKSPIKLGFAKPVAKDFQWLFTNHKTTYKKQQHVIDSFFGFSEALGVMEHVLRWEIPVPPAAQMFADKYLDSNKRILVISPCSSMAYRNWNAVGYARVADYAISTHGMQVVLCGGPSNIEQQYRDHIIANMTQQPVDLIGKTSLKELLAILNKADVLIAPDSGPAHLATAVSTPVIGLYATTNPDRARPYLSAEYTVNRYPEAVQDKYATPIEALPWGIRVRDAGTMDRITIEEVIGMLDKFMQTTAPLEKLT